MYLQKGLSVPKNDHETDLNTHRKIVLFLLYLQITVNESNAEQVSKELNEITTNAGNETNHLDVQFTAKTIVNLVGVTQKLEKVCHAL